MKKLMIAAAIVCAAAMSQAASVSWNSGEFTPLASCANEDGVTGAGDWESGCVKAFIWESATAFSYTTAAEVWNAYKDKLDTATVTGVYNVDAEALDVAGLNTYNDGQNVYAAILYLHDDNLDFEKPDFYMANIASGKAAALGGAVANLGNTFGGVGGTSASGDATVWTAAAVPEPTSGLLLLLGVAGLALRRRRA